METSIIILIVVVFLIISGLMAYFGYRYFVEPHYGDVLNVHGGHTHLLQPAHHDVHSAHHDVHSAHHDVHSTMAGHISHKMAKAKAHSNAAVAKINHAKHHLNQAQMHAKTH